MSFYCPTMRDGYRGEVGGRERVISVWLIKRDCGKGARGTADR